MINYTNIQTMFDYKLIEALAMVARESSLDKAAKVLYITQSAVSQRVKLLEEQVLLDIRLDDQEQTHRLLKDGEVR